MISKTIRATDPDNFRDLIPISGVFEMTDCEVEIYYPASATTDDLERITELIQSMIHVTDIRVTENPELDLNDKDRYKIVINEVGPNKPRFTRKRR